MNWFSQTYALVGFIFAFANIRKLYAWSSVFGLTPADVCSRPVMMPKSCLSASRLPTCSCACVAVQLWAAVSSIIVLPWWSTGGQGGSVDVKQEKKKTKSLLIQPHSGLFLVNFGLLVWNIWNLLDYFDASALYISAFVLTWIKRQTRNRNKSGAVNRSFKINACTCVV